MSDSKRKPSQNPSTSSTDAPSASIRTEKPFPLPEYVKDAIQKLTRAGFVAYVVGGCVRDFLLGLETKDYDIATSARPDDLLKLFPDANIVGKAFGVLKVGTHLEIATFRKDLEYKDHRRPVDVSFSNAKEDAIRRDFTINALFFDPKTQKILDYVGGLEDLQKKTLRAIGNPVERFREDALRLMRAIRFATRLGLTIDDSTGRAIRKQAQLLTKISLERISDELGKMLLGPAPHFAITLLSEFGLLGHVLPELEHLRKIKDAPLIRQDKTVWDNTISLLEAFSVGTGAKKLQPPSLALAWAALLHDIGKPTAFNKNEQKNFNNHEREGAKIAGRIARRLKLSNTDIDRVTILVSEHLKFREVFQMREATFLRWIRQPHFAELLQLHLADVLSSDGNLAYYDFCESRLTELKESGTSPPLVDGDDLISLGFSPGPEFSQILETIEDLALEKKLKSKQEALEYVVRHFVR